MRKIFDNIAFSKAIEESGMTKTDLANKIECSASDIHRYEKGLSTPRPERLKRLVEILGPSITGLSVVTDVQSVSKQFSHDEQQFLTWFVSIPYPRKCRILGFCEAVAAFGNDIDAEFAADLSEQLAHANLPPQEQLG